MMTAISARSHLLVTLLLAVPLALLGFSVASWWGVLGGLLVGSVLTARLLLRGVMDMPAAHPPAFIIAHLPDDTAEVDALRVAALKRAFDAAVLESTEPPARRVPVLH